MVRLKISILLTLAAMTIIPLLSQISASQQTLIDVSENLENGLITEAKEELSRCNYSNLSRQDKMEFQRLRGITYLLDGNKMVAREAVEGLLRLNPKYKEHPGLDPYEFTKYLTGIKIKRRWVMGFGMSVQSSSKSAISNYFHLVENQPVNDVRTTPSLEYNFSLGYHYNPLINVYISYLSGNTQLSEEFIDMSGVPYKADHAASFQGIELSNCFIFEKQNVNYLLKVGGGYQQVSRAFNQYQSIRNNEPLYSTQSVTDLLNVNQPYYVLGFGIELPLKNDKVTLNASYRGFISDYYNDAKRFNDLSSIIEYQYIPDGYVLQQMLFSVGYKKVLRYKIK